MCHVSRELHQLLPAALAAVPRLYALCYKGLNVYICGHDNETKSCARAKLGGDCVGPGDVAGVAARTTGCVFMLEHMDYWVCFHAGASHSSSAVWVWQECWPATHYMGMGW